MYRYALLQYELSIAASTYPPPCYYVYDLTTARTLNAIGCDDFWQKRA